MKTYDYELKYLDPETEEITTATVNGVERTENLNGRLCLCAGEVQLFSVSQGDLRIARVTATHEDD